MHRSDLITQIQFNNWANERLLATAKKIPQAKLRTGKLSAGNAFETLRHMLDVQWSWRLACQGEPATTLLWKIEPLETLKAAESYWQADGRRLLKYARSLRPKDFERRVKPSWTKRSYKIEHILLHIIHHGTNHRSEVGWYLTKLGYSPHGLEFLDFIARRK